MMSVLQPLKTKVNTIKGKIAMLEEKESRIGQLTQKEEAKLKELRERLKELLNQLRITTNDTSEDEQPSDDQPSGDGDGGQLPTPPSPSQPSLSSTENIEDKITEKVEKGEWYDALSLFRGLYSLLVEATKKKEVIAAQGQKIELDQVAMFLLPQYLIKEGIIKYNKPSMTFENKYLKNVLKEPIKAEVQKEINKKIKEELLAKSASAFIEGIPEIIKSEPYASNMREAKKILARKDVKEYLASMFKEDYENEEEALKLNPEETLVSALFKIQGLNSKYGIKVKESGLGSQLYQLITGVSDEK